MKAIVWTDGSCNANGEQGVGGWAAVIERDGTTGQELLLGRAVETTHNRMELTAVDQSLSGTGKRDLLAHMPRAPGDEGVV